MQANPSQPAIQIQETFPFREVSKKGSWVQTHVSVERVLAECGMVEIVGRAGFGFPNFPESKKVFQVAYFKINEGFKPIQPLFNGLISIGQPSRGTVEYYQALETFAVKYYQDDEQETASYLEKVFLVLKEEIRFKQILKTVIEKQARFEKESLLLNRELFGKA